MILRTAAVRTPESRWSEFKTRLLRVIDTDEYLMRLVHGASVRKRMVEEIQRRDAAKRGES